MLDPWIIEEILRRERERERAARSDRPVLELPLVPAEPPKEADPDDKRRDDEVERGVIILDYSG